MSSSAILTEQTWRAGLAPDDYVLGNVRAVLTDRIVDRARVVVRQGRIAEITDRPGAHDLDGAGLLVTPGFIDVHSDALEKEHAPRPSAELPWDFALTAFEGRCAASGVTTVFHGAAFRPINLDGAQRSVQKAGELCEVVDDAAGRRTRVDHRVLYRVDIISAESVAAFAERLAALPDNVVPLVSHEDHTPGQGQYADPTKLEDWLMQSRGLTRAEAVTEVADRRAEASELAGLRREHLDWFGVLAHSGRIRLLGHDPDTAKSVDELLGRGGAVAEFPTTVEAARRARELGLLIVAGAPNLLRGGSHTGNVSALALARGGLVDAIASDYLPPALLGSVARLARESRDLPSAVSLVTSGAARVAGLDDRGELAEGKRADLALIDDRAEWPHVVQTLTAR
ncbi:alpha-D-ribose 1-methylphosphonate 5-triphosphate diphosphatase [Enemella sp. A6]|uniref:alpha-D-ribose 1-methylphosphonate 5-triphosphate diphosphatase n=1 Tax=Enemella sp. A6 TaxID=3440152 RepID=UPI003EBC661F